MSSAPTARLCTSSTGQTSLTAATAGTARTRSAALPTPTSTPQCSTLLLIPLPKPGISLDGWKTLRRRVYSSDDDYKYGPAPEQGDVQVSTFYSLLSTVRSTPPLTAESPCSAPWEPENWALVDIDDGTYYIAEYIGILDKAGRTEEETEAVKAFAEWFGSADVRGCMGRRVRLLSLQHRRCRHPLPRWRSRYLHSEELCPHQC